MFFILIKGGEIIATVTSTLKMYDAMTRPLKNLTQGMNLLVSTMQQMQNATERNTNIDKALLAAKNQIAYAEADIRRSIEESERAQRKFRDEVDRSSRSAGILEQSFGSLATKVGSLVAGYMGINKIKNSLSDLLSTGVNFHAFKQQSESAFTTFLGDAEKAKKYMDNMYDFALTTPFAYPELLKSSRNLIAFGIQAEHTFPIMKAIGDTVAAIGGDNQELMGLAEVFGAIQVSGKISMMEVNRLGLYGVNAIDMLAKQSGVTADEMKKQISKGAVGAGTAITTLVEGMDKQFGDSMKGVKATIVGSFDSMKSAWRNAGTKIVEPFIKPLTNLIQNITNTFKQLPTLIGPAVQAFSPLIDMLNNAFEAGKFEPFFKVMSIGLQTISWLLSGVGMAAIWLAEVIAEYWPIITAFLVAWGMTYLPMVASAAYKAAIALMNVARAWLAALGPIGLVALAIGIVILVLKIFGVTTEQVLGVVFGLFGALFVSIYNGIAIIWNTILMFAEFIANIFVDPVYAVKKLFHDLAKYFIDKMYNMALSVENFTGEFMKGINVAINWGIQKINTFINAMNKIPGFNISTISFKTDPTNIHSVSDTFKKMSDAMDKVKPESDKDVFDWSKYKMEEKDVLGGFKKGWDIGTGIGEKLGDVFSLPDLNMPSADDFNFDGLGDLEDGLLNPLGDGKKGKQGKKPNIGKVDRVGKIDDTVDISSEDLKVMRDLAEMKSIQNFVTLTPTVEVTTGDINNGYDIDTIIRRIEKSLEEEIASAAKGVYS